MPIDEQAILDTAKERFKHAYEAEKGERQLAYDDLTFAVDHEGCQWPKEIRDQRENANPQRPVITVNKIPEKIDQAEGDFKRTMPKAKIDPVDSDADIKTAQLYDDLKRHIEYDSNAVVAYYRAQTSVFYCGRGAWRIDIEETDENPFIRELKINEIPNVFTVYFDPAAKKQTKEDADFVFVTEEIPKSTFEERYPDIEPEEWEEIDVQSWENWWSEETIRVAEYWWKEKVDKTFYQVKRFNEIKVVTKEDFMEGVDEILDEKTVKRNQIKWCLMTAGKVIEGPYDYRGKYFPFVYVVGKKININGLDRVRGSVRFAKESQRLLNYNASAAGEFTALSPKIPYLVTSSMISPYKDQWDSAAYSNYFYLMYEPDKQMPGVPPKREPPPQASSAILSEIQRADHDIMAAMGIYKASLGDASNEYSGVAIQERKQQAATGGFTFSKNFEIAYIHSTRILIDLIPYVYDTTRIARIRGEDEKTRKVTINAPPDQIEGEERIAPAREGITEYDNDVTVGKYDVVITMGADYATRRDEIVNKLVEIMQPAAQFGMGSAIFKMVLENLDMPNSQEVMQELENLEKQGQQEQAQQSEAMMEQVQTQVKQVMHEMMMEQREQNRKDFDSKIKAIKTLDQTELAEQKQEFEEIKGLLEEVRGFMPDVTKVVTEKIKQDGKEKVKTK